MPPSWLVTSLPTWLLVFIVAYAAATLYVAIRYREVRKFLAGAFFVSSGMLWYFWLTGTSVPIVLPYAGTIAVEPPAISGQRAIVHFFLFLLCFYFGLLGQAEVRAIDGGLSHLVFFTVSRENTVTRLAPAATLRRRRGRRGMERARLFSMTSAKSTASITANPAIGEADDMNGPSRVSK